MNTKTKILDLLLDKTILKVKYAVYDDNDDVVIIIETCRAFVNDNFEFSRCDVLSDDEKLFSNR